MVPNCLQGTSQEGGLEVLWEEVISLGAAQQSPCYHLQHIETLLKDDTLEPYSPQERGKEEKEESIWGDSETKPETGNLAPKQEACKGIESQRSLFGRICRSSNILQDTHFGDLHECKDRFEKHQGNLKEGKEHRCDQCGKSFMHNIGLIGHQRIYTGEKPFIYEECGRVFSQNTTPFKHLRIHTEESG
ncbi:zinc finger protein 135-like [Pongo pygmaeus]|uniref:zinc finger protein 135-like n=1 Tax=Pongo pygmaeus TaxID=9600 RepID=UPI0023E0FFE1|nr:zinc finger protein 135-like [Pongo pygmaeus]